MPNHKESFAYQKEIQNTPDSESEDTRWQTLNPQVKWSENHYHRHHQETEEEEETFAVHQEKHKKHLPFHNLHNERQKFEKRSKTLKELLCLTPI